MKLSRIGRVSMALAAAVALGLGMTACGGGTVGFMWVTGTTLTSTTASTIVGYKIDNFTGNLTTIVKSPFTSGGSDPGQIVVRSGGRYVYVVNKGTTNADGSSAGDGNIAEFLVGGDGVLSFQATFQTAGGTPVWAVMDSSGSYLYALDRLAPAGSTYYAAGLGDVTVFSVAADTGRLSTVTNQQVKGADSKNINYFPVGANPTMMRVQATSCLFVLDKNNGSDAYNTAVFPYQIASAGQLTTTVTGNVPTGASNLSSITTGGGTSSITTGGGTFIYLTDIGPSDSAGAPTTTGLIYDYTVGTNCALNAVVTSPVANVEGTQSPVWTLTEARNSRYVYVLNKSNTNASQANSSISIFTIDTTGKLTQAAGITNPIPVGSAPTCMIEDPTNKYLYVSNSGDGTVTGKALNLSTGALSDLQHGSNFSAFTHASCLTVSGAVN